MTTGRVSLVGAGPGDPDLITVRGRRLLAECDAVVYDRLVDPALLAYAPTSARRVNVGKAPGLPSATQEDINALLIQLASEGKRVVRLKGGDPFVFGRGGEEGLALQSAGVPWEIVPGISAAIAAAGSAGIPVTHRGLSASFTVASGHNALEQAGGLSADVLVILMGINRLEDVIATLLRNGRSTDEPAAIIEGATTPRQRATVATLGTIADLAQSLEIRPPATLVVGSTVPLWKRLAGGDPSTADPEPGIEE